MNQISYQLPLTDKCFAIAASVNRITPDNVFADKESAFWFFFHVRLIANSKKKKLFF